MTSRASACPRAGEAQTPVSVFSGDLCLFLPSSFPPLSLSSSPPYNDRYILNSIIGIELGKPHILSRLAKCPPTPDTPRERMPPFRNRKASPTVRLRFTRRMPHAAPLAPSRRRLLQAAWRRQRRQKVRGAQCLCRPAYQLSPCPACDCKQRTAHEYIARR